MNPTVMIYSSRSRPILAVPSVGRPPGRKATHELQGLLRYWLAVLRKCTKRLQGLVVPCSEVIVAVGQHFLNVRARHALALARAAVVCQQENRGCALNVHCRPHYRHQQIVEPLVTGVGFRNERNSNTERQQAPAGAECSSKTQHQQSAAQHVAPASSSTEQAPQRQSGQEATTQAIRKPGRPFSGQQQSPARSSSTSSCMVVCLSGLWSVYVRVCGLFVSLSLCDCPRSGVGECVFATILDISTGPKNSSQTCHV